MSDAMPLPPPTFEFLVLSLKTQTEMHLGLFSFGENESAEEPDLPSARHAIDMLAMIAEKTRGNLSIEEQRLIENSLTELRFRFVQVNERQGKEKAKAAQAPAEPESAG
jgi:hypothetical protein